MNNKLDTKQHWNEIYNRKKMENLSWFQAEPKLSLDFIRQLNLDLSASIIDVGGGDSLFVDYLLEMGFTNISVLDISESALNRAKKRLGDKANLVNWIVADVSKFTTKDKFDFWHDRAAFHFLTKDDQISDYIKIAQDCINPSGLMLIGTFSENGPTKCSDIEIKQYSESSMTKRLSEYFEKIRCVSVDHETPNNKLQNFVFCSFRKLK